ncbi:MerR family DNA-binding transcriptional regulator, partial [Patescibacteria group bacterium]|nr:MerR family DNA-binding transcriptional regulator [Patescibacteria group bacterium]
MKKLPRADAVQAKTLPSRQGFHSVRGNLKTSTSSQKIKPKNDEFLTITSAAEILGVSTKTLRRWEEKGILLPQRTSGGHRRYTLSSISDLKKKKGKKRVTARVTRKITAPEVIKKPTVAETPSFPGSAPEGLSPQWEAVPSLYRGLAIPQKRVLAFSFFSLIVATSVFAATRIPGILDKLPQSVPELVSSLIVGKHLPDGFEEDLNKRVLGVALNTQTFKVNVESIFAEDVSVERNLTVVGNTSIGGNLDVDWISNDIAGTL